MNRQDAKNAKQKDSRFARLRVFLRVFRRVFQKR
jgi:hypothetical protein